MNMLIAAGWILGGVCTVVLFVLRGKLLLIGVRVLMTLPLGLPLVTEVDTEAFGLRYIVLVFSALLGSLIKEDLDNRVREPASAERR